MKSPAGEIRDGNIENWMKATVVFMDYMKKFPETKDQKLLASMVLAYTVQPPNQAKQMNANANAVIAAQLHDVVESLLKENK